MHQLQPCSIMVTKYEAALTWDVESQSIPPSYFARTSILQRLKSIFTAKSTIDRLVTLAESAPMPQERTVVLDTIKGLLDEEARVRAIKREKHQKTCNTMGEGLVTVAYGIGIFHEVCAPVTVMGLFAWTKIGRAHV